MKHIAPLAVGLVAALHAGVAHADDPPTPSEPLGAGRTFGETIQVQSASPIAVAQDFVVLPDGVELAGDLRTITADGGLGTGRLKLTDLALFDAHLVWAIGHRYELDASVSILAKQPSSTSEDVFQGGSLTLRRAFDNATALALGGTASPLIDLAGAAYGGSLFLTHKKRLNEVVSFGLAGGANAIAIDATTAMDTAVLVEGAVRGDVLVRADSVWGGWLGVGYALPAYHHGRDPISGMALDPQTRLDVDIGNGVQLSDDWYLSADLAIIDRGDLANAATRLPILDGGFDQIQIMVGITRRVRGWRERNQYRDHGLNEPALQL